MNIALILSGGTGSRMGASKPKQYMTVKDRPIIAYSLACFAGHPMIDRIQIVADKQWQAEICSWVGSKPIGFSKPGTNRQLSIWSGLTDILEYADASDHVIIHDAARPMVSAKLITDCLEMLEEHEGVVPVLPVKDTVYLGEDGHIASLLERDRVLAGQAPEGFVLGKYYQANKNLLPDKILRINGSTEPAVLAGMDVVYIRGEEENFKITTKADLKRFEQLLNVKESI